MNPQQQRVSAFTFEFTHLAPQLLTPIGISTPFDPATPLDKRPKIKEVQALWDTGASGCVITKRLAAKLNLIAVGTGTSKGIGGEHQCSTFVVNLFLPNGIAFAGVMVSDSPLEDNFDVIIGMNVITQGDMALSHVGGKTLFSFRMPSIQKLDFAPKQTHVNIPVPKRRPNDPCHCGSGRKFKKCHGARA